MSGGTMITTLVQFHIGNSDRLEAIKKVFTDSMSRYQQVPGLLRKYYLISEDQTKAGGVYLWASREDADGLYTDEWKQMIRDKYGSDPVITYFETPIIVDNQYDTTQVE